MDRPTVLDPEACLHLLLRSTVRCSTNRAMNGVATKHSPVKKTSCLTSISAISPVHPHTDSTIPTIPLKSILLSVMMLRFDLQESFGRRVGASATHAPTSSACHRATRGTEEIERKRHAHIRPQNLAQSRWRGTENVPAPAVERKPDGTHCLQLHLSKLLLLQLVP